ncbi:MAG: hypothetical protein ACRDRI_17925 [Pseudonocardiaceae bacterium]
MLPGFGDREVFALGVRLARERFAELGLSESLPHERAFVGVASTRPAWGGFHYPNPAPEGLPPGYRYVQAAAVITRYDDMHGDMPSTPGVAGLDLIRNYTHDFTPPATRTAQTINLQETRDSFRCQNQHR